jgi:predicted ATPase
LESREKGEVCVMEQNKDKVKFALIGFTAASVIFGGVLKYALSKKPQEDKNKKIEFNSVVKNSSSEASAPPPEPHLKLQMTRGVSILSQRDDDESVISDVRVFKFVLTGGPCAGKSSALAEVSDRLRSLGYQVFLVPEIPTFFHQVGASYSTASTLKMRKAWEKNKVTTQLQIEDTLTRYAKATNRNTVLLCDRGALDTKAYVDAPTFQEILKELDIEEISLRDERYDAVVHLVTAALGAETFYTQANNQARRETIEGKLFNQNLKVFIYCFLRGQAS